MPQLYLSLYPKSNKSLNPKHLSNQASYFFHCYPSNSGLPHLFPRPTPEHGGRVQLDVSQAYLPKRFPSYDKVALSGYRSGTEAEKDMAESLSSQLA